MVTDKRKEKWKKAKKHWEKNLIIGTKYSPDDEKIIVPDDDNTKASNYCYNHTNRDPSQKDFPHHKKGYLGFLFVHDGKDKGKYEYIGFGKESTLGVTEVVETFRSYNSNNTTPVGIWYKGKYYVPNGG
jgi:hypothetical protein